MIRPNRKVARDAEKKGPRLWAWQKPLVAGMGICLIVMWLIEGAEMTQYMRMANELNRMKQKIVNLKQANAALEQEIQLIRDDPYTLEKLARERLGYVKEGEVVYQLVVAE